MSRERKGRRFSPWHFIPTEHFVPPRRGCQQLGRCSLRVGSWVQSKQRNEIARCHHPATICEALSPVRAQTHEQVHTRQLICPVHTHTHTHTPLVASTQQFKINQPSFPRDSANSNYLPPPCSSPGLNQNERETHRAAAGSVGIPHKTQVCAGSCEPTFAHIPALLSHTLRGYQQWPKLPQQNQHHQLLPLGDQNPAHAEGPAIPLPKQSQMSVAYFVQ